MHKTIDWRMYVLNFPSTISIQYILDMSKTINNDKTFPDLFKDLGDKLDLDQSMRNFKGWVGVMTYDDDGDEDDDDDDDDGDDDDDDG